MDTALFAPPSTGCSFDQGGFWSGILPLSSSCTTCSTGAWRTTFKDRLWLLFWASVSPKRRRNCPRKQGRSANKRNGSESSSGKACMQLRTCCIQSLIQLVILTIQPCDTSHTDPDPVTYAHCIAWLPDTRYTRCYQHGSWPVMHTVWPHDNSLHGPWPGHTHSFCGPLSHLVLTEQWGWNLL